MSLSLTAQYIHQQLQSKWNILACMNWYVPGLTGICIDFDNMYVIVNTSIDMIFIFCIF